jgi:hypothetical protein
MLVSRVCLSPCDKTWTKGKEWARNRKGRPWWSILQHVYRSCGSKLIMASNQDLHAWPPGQIGNRDLRSPSPTPPLGFFWETTGGVHPVGLPNTPACNRGGRGWGSSGRRCWRRCSGSTTALSDWDLPPAAALGLVALPRCCLPHPTAAPAPWWTATRTPHNFHGQQQHQPDLLDHFASIIVASFFNRLGCLLIKVF